MPVATIYMVPGGLRAAYWTDVLQGVQMYVGILVAALLIIGRLAPGGLPQIMDQLRTLRPALLTTRWDPTMMLGTIMLYGPGLMLLPHPWIKYYMARDERMLKSSAVGTALYLSSYYIPAAIIGLSAAVVNAVGMPGVLEKGFMDVLRARCGSGDTIVVTMITTFLHPAVAGFLLAGAAAAAMSTLDSFPGSTSLVLTRDIYRRYIRPKRSEEEYVLVSRLLMFV